MYWPVRNLRSTARAASASRALPPSERNGSNPSSTDGLTTKVTSVSSAAPAHSYYAVCRHKGAPMTMTVLLTVLLSVLYPAQEPALPQSAASRALDERGAHAMEFDQAKTTHHFLLYRDGGAIDVSVKNPSDTTERDAVRKHLPHLAMLFGQGSFELPHFIHATDVPGTATMKRLKDRIAYRYRQTPGGGRVD